MRLLALAGIEETAHNSAARASSLVFGVSSFGKINVNGNCAKVITVDLNTRQAGPARSPLGCIYWSIYPEMGLLSRVLETVKVDEKPIIVSSLKTTRNSIDNWPRFYGSRGKLVAFAFSFSRFRTIRSGSTIAKVYSLLSVFVGRLRNTRGTVVKSAVAHGRWSDLPREICCASRNGD